MSDSSGSCVGAHRRYRPHARVVILALSGPGGTERPAVGAGRWPFGRSRGGCSSSSPCSARTRSHRVMSCQAEQRLGPSPGSDGSPALRGTPAGRAIRRANADRFRATASHAEPLFRLVKCPVSPAGRRLAMAGRDWGSRGRRFKSGRPDAAHRPADHSEH